MDRYGRRKDGTEVPLEIGLSPVRTGEGRFVLAAIVDLTERRQAEDQLRESGQELRRLTGRLLESQESERRRVARELHDDVNQGLALLTIEMELLASSPPESPAAVACQLRELGAGLKALSSSVHGLSHRLHPSKLEQLGLVAAVRDLCREIGQGHGLEVKFTHSPDPGPLPPDAALCLYRIAQEALRNVVKHSAARHAAVGLDASDQQVRLQITDDGSGFDPAVARGLGLVSMRERLNLVGGRLTIDSRPAAGTRIDVVVPIHATIPNGEYHP
jgi:signal transduction histidine kinase